MTVRGSIRSALSTPSLSLLDIITEGPVHRFQTLAMFLVTAIDVIAVAVDRWMDEIERWLVITGVVDEGDGWNHNPWGDAVECDPVTFEQ